MLNQKNHFISAKQDRLFIMIGYAVIAIMAVMTYVLLHGHIDAAMDEAVIFGRNQISQVEEEICEQFDCYLQICDIAASKESAVEYTKAYLCENNAEMRNWSDKLRKELTYTVNLYDADIKTLAIFFPDNDSIVSMSQWYEPGSAEHFFDSYSIINKEMVRTTASSDSTSIYLDDTNQGRGWIVRKTRIYGNSIGYILLVFDLQAVAERSVSENVCLLLGTENECSYAYGALPEEYSYDVFAKKCSQQDMFSYGKHTYIGRCRQLKHSDYQAFLGVHLEKFTQMQKLFRLVTVSASTVCILSILALLTYLETQIFAPIQALSLKITKKCKNMKETIASWEANYISLVQENEEICEELGDLKSLGLGTLLIRLIDETSTFSSPENVTKCMRMSGLSPDDKYLAFAVHCTENAETVIDRIPVQFRDSTAPSVMYFALNNAVRDCLSPHYWGAIAPVSPKGYIIITRYISEEDCIQIKKGIQSLQQLFQDHFRLRIIATNPVYGEGETKFKECITSVCKKLAYMEFWGDDMISESELGTTDAFYYRKQLRNFTNHLTNGDYDSALVVFEDILRTGIPKVESNLELTKFRIYGITSMLITAINEQFGANQTLISNIKTEQRLYHIRNITEFRNEVHQVLLEIVEYRKSQPATSSQNAEQIKQYIKAHYSESEISLGSVANHFEMSEAHISRLFKHNYGINFSEYIQQLRIEKAKELLKKYSVKESAIMVGFWNTQSFTRAFKKCEGITPGEFKKNTL